MDYSISELSWGMSLTPYKYSHIAEMRNIAEIWLEDAENPTF